MIVWYFERHQSRMSGQEIGQDVGIGLRIPFVVVCPD